ncbi:MFS transporter (plasmid) [Pseudalkalibacillus hwajinpoensis]|uniref:MFS transporter n=1 Tax=Guptibacillus hwajinpoensis TaxID=208199 RepID=UPI00325AE6EA
MTLGNSMLIPVLPLIEKKLRISSFQVSLIITVYSIVAIALIPIAGYLSDRLGRRVIMIPCLVLAGIGGVVSGWASWQMDDPFHMILVGRVLQGIGSAGAAPVVIPLIGDMFSDDKEITAGLGTIETSNTVGKVLSPIIGALLASFIWFLPFWFIPFFSLISVLLVIFLVKIPDIDNEKQSVTEFTKCVKDTFKANGKWLYAIFVIGCIIMFVLFGVLFYLSDTLETYHHIKGVKKGFFLAIPLLFLSISSFVSGKKMGQKKKLMKLVIAGGMGLLALSFVALRLQHSFLFLLLFLVFSGIGIGMALPCLDALITEGIDKGERGTITSFYSAMRFIGVAAGPPVYASVMSVSHHLVFYLSGGISLFALLIVIVFVKPEEKKESTIKYA